MLANAPENRARPPRIAAFWLGIQAVWGALLAISLQSRALELRVDPVAAIKLGGTILAIGAAVAAVTQIVAGIFSDRQRAGGGRRIAYYVIGTFVGVVGIAWFYLATDVVQLAIGFAVVELGLNVAAGAYQAVVPDTIEPARTGLASSWLAGMQSLGNGLGAILATVVVQTRLVGAALIAVLLTTCAITVAHLRGCSYQPLELAPRTKPVSNFANLFGSRLLLYAGFYTLLFNVYYFVAALAPNATAAAQQLLGGATVLIFTLCGALGALLAARPSDRADKRLVVTVGGIGFAAACIALPEAGSFTALFAVAIVGGAAWGAVLVADWALACRVLPQRAMATSMAVWNLAVILGQVAATQLARVALELTKASNGQHALHAIFVVAAVESCLGILWIWRLPGALARE